MAINFNTNNIKNINFNGVEIRKVNINNVNVYTKGGSVLVKGTAASFGTTISGTTYYPFGGSINIGTGYTNVTISASELNPNEITYNPSSGIANYMLYSRLANKIISATITYS